MVLYHQSLFHYGICCQPDEQKSEPMRPQKMITYSSKVREIIRRKKISNPFLWKRLNRIHHLFPEHNLL